MLVNELSGLNELMSATFSYENEMVKENQEIYINI